jgi:hypothetical protein
MIPILTPLVLGLVGYEYFKYSRNNEQIQILVNKVTYSNFQTIQDIYKLFGSSEGASLLNSIYDSIMSFDQSLVPTHYHHINFLKLSAIIPAAVVDYGIKGFVDGLKSSGFISKSLPKSNNTIKPLKKIDQSLTKYDDQTQYNHLDCAKEIDKDSKKELITCNGSSKPFQGKPKSEIQKWIIKVPHTEEKIKINYLHRGSDQIDLREFDVSCDALTVTKNNHFETKVFFYDQRTETEHHLEINFLGRHGLNCHDFVFSKNSKGTSDDLIIHGMVEQYNGEDFYAKTCSKKGIMAFDSTVDMTDHVFCIGSEVRDRNQIIDIEKTILKVPKHMGRLIKFDSFDKGKDFIDLREYDIKSCDELYFHKSSYETHVMLRKEGTLSPYQTYTGDERFIMEFKYLKEPTCEDFIFNAE